MVPRILETALPWKSADDIKVLSDIVLDIATATPETVAFVDLFTPVSWHAHIF